MSKTRKQSLVFGIGLLLVLTAALVLWLLGKGGAQNATSSSGQPSTATSGAPASDYKTIPLPKEMRANWISFLEWEGADLTTEAAFVAYAEAAMEQIAGLGLNTVIVAVHPMGDALYESELFPYSHLLSGTQGQNPGYDPLQILCDTAHASGLRIEANVNPLRVRHAAFGPETLAPQNPAAQNPTWVYEAAGAAWYNPGIPEVRQLITDGIYEIAAGYPVDGICFDDYFYASFSAEEREQGLDSAFDAAQFAQYGQGRTLGDWRRHNVSELVRSCYAATKRANPTLSFGMSPEGNNQNNYTMQHSDVELWMREEGYIDYVMPQLYWGFDYVGASGSSEAAFRNKVAEWAGYQRSSSVRLYAALGAFCVVDGDGSSADSGEWRSGHNLADMVKTLRGNEAFSGFSLFRHQYLFGAEDEAMASERQNLQALLNDEKG